MNALELVDSTYQEIKLGQTQSHPVFLKQSITEPSSIKDFKVWEPSQVKRFTMKSMLHYVQDLYKAFTSKLEYLFLDKVNESLRVEGPFQSKRT